MPHQENVLSIHQLGDEQWTSSLTRNLPDHCNMPTMNNQSAILDLTVSQLLTRYPTTPKKRVFHLPRPNHNKTRSYRPNKLTPSRLRGQHFQGVHLLNSCQTPLAHICQTHSVNNRSSGARSNLLTLLETNSSYTKSKDKSRTPTQPHELRSTPIDDPAQTR